MATKQLNSKERKQAQPVSRSYTTAKGDKVSVLKNGTKMVNGAEAGKVATPAGTRMVMGQSGSSRLVKIGSGADAKYDDKGNYKKATYTSPFKNTIQTTTGQRNRDTATQNRYNEIMTNRMGSTPATPALPTVTTPANQSTRTGNGQPVPSDIQNNAATVTGYTDNGDGTTTNTLSDGTTSTVRYIKNADGSMTPVEVGSGDGSSPILDAEKEFTANTRQQLADLESQKSIFDKKIDRLLASNNSLYQGTIASIKSTFDSRADSLKENYARLGASRTKAGFQTDSFRYTPTHAEGIITNDENNMVNDLADLDAQEQALILAATTAKEAKDWDALDAQMKMYDTMSQQKTTLLTSLLTAATAQNRRIEDEAKIEREIAEKALATKQGDGAIKLAANIAPVISKAIANMTEEEAVAYVTKKATDLGIDPDILRSQVIDRSREDADYARSLIPKPEKPKALTEEDIFAGIDTILSNPNSALYPESCNQSMAPVPFRDPSGFLTVDGYKTLVSQARSNGVSKSKFLENYGGELDPNNLAAYGLTAKEQEALGY